MDVAMSVAQVLSSYSMGAYTANIQVMRPFAIVSHGQANLQYLPATY